jgi:hypothetical protein
MQHTAHGSTIRLSKGFDPVMRDAISTAISNHSSCQQGQYCRYSSAASYDCWTVMG